MTFRLAHLSDPHVGPLPTPRGRELLGKRLTGYWNWHKSRQGIHRMDVLEAITRDIIDQKPDHIALTGDLVNIGLASEFPLAERHLACLGTAAEVSVIPGNHDAYVRDSLAAMHRVYGPHMQGDDAGHGFPYLRTRGPLAFIGVSSAVPTLPFMATGTVGHAQRLRFESLLGQARATHRATVVMIHHPPHVGGARWGRGLTDARQLEAILARHGADLVIHGHNHRHSIARIPGPGGTSIPVVGVASASAVPGSPAHRAAYHLFSFREHGGGMSIGLDIRGIDSPGASVTLLGSKTIRD